MNGFKIRNSSSYLILAQLIIKITALVVATLIHTFNCAYVEDMV